MGVATIPEASMDEPVTLNGITFPRVKNPHPVYSVEVAISPENASRLLATSPGNRKISMAQVRKYASIMKGGTWLPFSYVSLDDKMRLMDGHHRMEAVVLSQTTQKFILVVGAEREQALLGMDQGRMRNWEALTGMPNSMGGLINSSLYGMAQRKESSAFLMILNSIPLKVRAKEILDPHISRIHDLFNTELRSRYKTAPKATRQNAIIGACVRLALHYPYDQIETFAEGLVSGANLSADSAIYKFRSKVISMSSAANKVRGQPEVLYYYTFHYFEQWITNGTVRARLPNMKTINPVKYRFPAHIADQLRALCDHTLMIEPETYGKGLKGRRKSQPMVEDDYE